MAERADPLGAPGVRLLGGRYQLAQVLGYGGMAEVYHARDVRLQRDVALKVLRSDLARDQTFQTRFRREAQSAAALNHPAIVAVYDTGTDEKHDPPLPYIVMEYVEGRTLRDLIQTGGRLTQRRAVEIVVDVCGALEYSHRAGIVHRDIKPGNVMITSSGGVKVMDFGIARAVAESTSTVTQTAAVMGTAQYLSPEQARGERVDARSDLYSAGVVLYELLTGQPPFRGDSPVAVAYQHVREDPICPSDLEADLSADVDAVVMKALAKNPANRYQSASEFSDDLGRLLSGRKVLATPLLRDPALRPAGAGVAGARPAAARRRRNLSPRRVVTLALLVLLAAGAVVGGLLLARDQGSSNGKVAVPPLQGMTRAAAERLIRQTGLVVGKESGQKSSLPLETVLSTDPPQGTKLARDTRVDLTYSTGLGSVPIPADVVGKSQADAEKELRGLGLSTRISYVVDLNHDPGKVSSTNPSPGSSVNVQGVPVEILVTNDQTTVPPVTNQSLGAAQTALFAADLQFNVVRINSSAPDGMVLQQDIAAGRDAKRGSFITLTVSNHPPPPSATPSPPKPTPHASKTPKPTPSKPPHSSPSPHP